ncbi:hypothetical protein NDU88_004298 [Pleurodeles waltl]|uniref:Uncharacterized protein n=1 Tax=Pleurodeles waltl TaxID=8319 RepID=A0AAV7RKX7_PLEWA|nr:hypothetical protein NDU88_004298 [Pleurodeles waltl]
MQSSPPPSPDRRLTESRGGSSTPPGLGASNSSSALLDPGTYGPKQRGEIPGSPCCHPRTERTGDPERLSLKTQPSLWPYQGQRTVPESLPDAQLRLVPSSARWMEAACECRIPAESRMTDCSRRGRFRTFPLRQSEASERRTRTGLTVGGAALFAAGDRALRRERCSPRRGRPGSPLGALLPSRGRPGSPSGPLLPSSRETRLSVRSAAPLAAGTGLTVGSTVPLVAGDRALRRERCSPRRGGPGSTVGSVDSLVVGDQAHRRERCSRDLRRER